MPVVPIVIWTCSQSLFFLQSDSATGTNLRLELNHSHYACQPFAQSFIEHLQPAQPVSI